MALLYVRTGNSGADPAYQIDDLGFTVPTGASWTLLASSAPAEAGGSNGQFTAREIRDSADLYAAITGDSLEWSRDGITAESGSDYVADWMLMQDFTDDFLNLASGALVLPQGTSAPASGVEGQIFWNSSADTTSIWDGSQWTDISATVDHGGLGGLGDDDHTQYLLLSGDRVRNAVTGGIDMSGADIFILPQATDPTTLSGVEGALAWDTDDEALWAYDGTQWFAIAPASGIISDHGGLSGLSDDDHPQYHDGSLAYTGNLDMGSYAITNVGNVDGVDVSAFKTSYDNHVLNQDYSHDQIDSHILDSSIHFTVGSIDHGSISGLGDDDHPQYTEWNNTETVSGLWTFDTADANPSLILDPKPSAPSTNLADGALTIVGGILYAYDATRSKWLSVDRQKFIAGRKGSATNLYLRTVDGVPTSQTGLRMLRNGTIVGLFAQTDGAETWVFEIRRNSSAIATLSISAATGGQAVNTNVDVSQGDEIQLYCNGTAIDTPVAGFEIAWRV